MFEYEVKVRGGQTLEDGTSTETAPARRLFDYWSGAMANRVDRNEAPVIVELWFNRRLLASS
jgi:hypothetical protein